MAMPPEPGPVIPAEVTLPEITVKAVLLSIVLAAVLAGANAYLGLFAGMTVSASIPAAVVSMSVLRLFRESNILENNIVQTAASSGEALAAGVIFTIPALLLIGYWTSFDYGQTAAIAAGGGRWAGSCSCQCTGHGWAPRNRWLRSTRPGPSAAPASGTSASARCSSAGSGPSSSFGSPCSKGCGGRSQPIATPRSAGVRTE